MKVLLVYITYTIIMNLVAATMWLHLIGMVKQTNFNISIILITGLFTTFIFAEIAFNKRKLKKLIKDNENL